MYAPLDFFVKNGYGSKYLTGLLTPDGITFLALLNNFLELYNIQLYYVGLNNYFASEKSVKDAPKTP